MQSLGAHLRWDDVRVLLALIRSGSLKRAAVALGVNISTVSRRLDALEEETGVHLFDRTPEGTKPTVAAEQLMPFAERMEAAAMGLMRGVEALEIEPEGEVRIAAPPGVVDHFLAPAVGELCTRYPRLRIHILSAIAYADLTRREADVALRLGRPESGDLVAKRVVAQGWSVIASTEHAGELGTLRRADAARWVTWGPDLAHLPDRRWVDANVPPERCALITNSMTAQLEAVRAGYGVMLAPAVYGELRGLAAVRCSRKLRQSIAALPIGSLWLVGHRAHRQVPRIAAVWGWLEEAFGGG
ncbi:MAG: LysR family transcriptional regulator [Polyangiaceae bacterium]